MSPERFDHLLSMTRPMLEKRCTNRKPISPEARLTLTLRYLATGNSQMSEAFDFVIAPQTISKILRETCHAIWTVLQDYIKAPNCEAEWLNIAKGFNEKWNFPNAVGALDGKHVRIQCPRYSGSDFFNYKHFHSINLMAMCDADYKFTFVDIGAYGRDNDAAVFGRSDLYDGMDKNTVNRPPPTVINGKSYPHVILGDEIFPLKPWLLKPYPGKNLNEKQTVFNYRLSRARRTIENAFGILCARWRIFRTTIHAGIDLIELIVKAATALHNYLLSTENARYTPTGFTDCFSASGDLIEGSWREGTQQQALATIAIQGTHNHSENAKTVRDQFCEYVNSAEGAVEWQLDHVRDTGRD